MARLLADEDFHGRATDELIVLGHDVLTVQTAGVRGIQDADLLAFATALGRSVLTHNRRHFIRLHAIAQPHAGIVVCTRDDANPVALAGRIDSSIARLGTLANVLVRVNRPAPSRHKP
ncbi:MAG TPA: DUF5615 family PIN-like protein [Gemmataceae bacterium]|jgi:hypothetical protein|nr:DUF5615 family PIN-like protein [Gemmataceae bacterium]